MKVDDYPVIEYKILHYLYGCIKIGAKPDIRKIDEKALCINQKYWEWIMRMLQGDRHIVGVFESQDDGIQIGELSITAEGARYLLTSEIMKNAKALIKDTKSLLPRVEASEI